MHENRVGLAALLIGERADHLELEGSPVVGLDR
ncbi:hypothetical protein CARN8_2550009 [mine drainage metagenome]|uniref:Uncharacterized protein n=1 Tax=mine drainage metagenome TaxID=410659 RepID=A0A3P3ZN54_9ZZZZ